MNRDIYSQAEQLNKKHRRKRTWYKILSVPICLVVFVTTYALILPAITMESTPDTYCGIAEHVHTDDCYELPGTPAHKEVQCTAGADLGQGEYIVHKHDSFCFDDSGELLCALAEQDEHVHTDACYDGDSLICGLVTGIVHQHTADCVISVPATEPQGLVCTVEEHKHTEACFMNPEGEAPSGETGGDVPADKTPASDVPTGDDPSNETPKGDVPTDAAQGSSVPGDAVQSTGAANGDTPEDDAAVNSTPARAPAASGLITDVTLTINDNVSASGCYEAAVTGGGAALEGKNVRYQWYKSTNSGATYTAVKAKNFTVGSNTVSNIGGDRGEKLFLALDGGTVSDTLPSVTYKAVLKVDGTEYNSVSAVRTNTMKASGLALGYYFVSGTSGAVCELATAKDIQIRDKNEVPQIEKSVDDNDGTVEIGQKLTYTITGKVPSTKGYTEFTYQVTDTMTEGLTFNKDVKVTIGGVEVTAAATITNNENGFVASVNMMNYQDQIDAPVVITYTAIVNENAIQREKETNAATLKYSNNPADKTTFEESSVEVDVFSFNIVINKYAANNAETKLEGAKFVLKNNEGKYYKYDAATKAVTWVAAKADATEVSTDANGAARFDGLQAGTYSLEETVAPAGYNQLTKDITIVLDKNGSATIDGAASAPGAAHSLTTGVANSTGTVLPETGGTGTVIFVALGALAVICAGVFLVTNKRMSKESF